MMSELKLRLPKSEAADGGGLDRRGLARAQTKVGATLSV